MKEIKTKNSKRINKMFIINSIEKDYYKYYKSDMFSRTFFYRTSVFMSYVKKVRALLTRWHNEKKSYLIYGAGIHSQELLRQVRPKPSLFLGFIDQSVSKQKNGFLRFSVYPIEKAVELKAAGILISSYEYQEDMKDCISKFGLKEIEIMAIYPKSNQNDKTLSCIAPSVRRLKGEKGRIAVVDSFFSWPPAGGSSVDIASVMNYLSKSGFNVTFFLPLVEDDLYYPRGRLRTDEGIDFDVVNIHFKSSCFNLEHFIEEMGSAVESYNPDFLFLGDMYAFKPYLAERLNRYKTIWRSYAYDLICPRVNLLDYEGQNCRASFLADPEYCRRCIKNDKYINWDQPQFREIALADIFSKGYYDVLIRNIARADHIIVYNDILKDRLNNRFSSLTNLHIIPTGIEPARFFTDRVAEREEVTILFPGRVYDPVKGLEFFLEVFRRIRRVIQHVRAITTGRVDIEEDGVKNAGWISQERLPDLYCQADICVIPSIWEEPFGIVALEAMASGLPIVASAAGGLKHIIRHGETGFLAAPGDHDSFFHYLTRLIINKNLRREMGEAGISRIEQYSWDMVMLKYKTIFDT